MFVALLHHSAIYKSYYGLILAATQTKQKEKLDESGKGLVVGAFPHMFVTHL